jgi:hypothetical protein
MTFGRGRFGTFLVVLACAVCAPPLAVPKDLQAKGARQERAASAPNERDTALQEAARRGIVIGQSLGPKEALKQHKQMTAALNQLQPQRKGILDTYVLAIGLDSDAVFSREATQAGAVLSRRYGGEGRTLVLTTGTHPQADATSVTHPSAHPNHIAAALAQMGVLMDANEDVLVLYITTHGHWLTGLSYRDQDRALGNIAPSRLAQLLDEAGIKNRLIILSACYSGIFVPDLQNQYSVTMTAAAAGKPSFGCQADNDWTFFGDAFINHALREPTPTLDAFAAARTRITQWEVALRLSPSNPQVDVGTHAQDWLTKLDTRIPKTATAPSGKPAFTPPP